LAGFNESAQQKACKLLTKYGASIELATAKSEINLSSYDTVYECIGYSLNSEFMLRHFKDCLNDRGQINVNDYLQIITDTNKVTENIFAVGDICRTKLSEEKVVIVAELETEIAVENIKKLSNYKTLGLRVYPKLKKIPASLSGIPKIYLISVGEHCLVVFGEWCISTSLGNLLKKIIEVTKILELKQYRFFIFLWHIFHFTLNLLHYFYLIIHFFEVQAKKLCMSKAKKLS